MCSSDVLYKNWVFASVRVSSVFEFRAISGRLHRFKTNELIILFICNFQQFTALFHMEISWIVFLFILIFMKFFRLFYELYISELSEYSYF